MKGGANLVKNGKINGYENNRQQNTLFELRRPRRRRPGALKVP